MKQRPYSILLLILLVSVLLRVGVAFYLGDQVPPATDELSYATLGARLAEGYGYSFPENWYPFTPAGTPTAHWSFLYTAVVAAIYTLFGVHPLAVRLVGAVVGGVLLPLAVYLLSKRLFPQREGVALLAAAITAVYAYFILFAAQLMTETLYVTAVLYSLERALALADRLRAGKRPSAGLILSFGLILGLATLLRQSILPWLVILFAGLLWFGVRQRQIRATLLALTGSGLILLAFILPFTIRNYRVYDDFLLLNSNAGYAMYSAQHPLHGTSFQAFTGAPLPGDLEPPPQNEAQWDRLLMARGIQFVLADPGRYLLLSLSRLADYFMFWPSAQTTLVNNIGRVLSFGLFLPLMLYGLWLSRRDWRRWGLLYAFMAFYTVLHLLTWAMVRYRLPVDAVLILFAAVALADLWARWATRRKGLPAWQQATAAD